MTHFCLVAVWLFVSHQLFCFCSLQRGGGQHVDHWAHLADDGHSESPRPPADGQVCADVKADCVTPPPCGHRAELLLTKLGSFGQVF